MNKTEWSKMSRVLSGVGSGSYRFNDNGRSYTEIVKRGPFSFSMYSVYRGSYPGCRERYCIDVANNLGSFRYILD